MIVTKDLEVGDVIQWTYSSFSYTNHRSVWLVLEIRPDKWDCKQFTGYNLDTHDINNVQLHLSHFASGSVFLMASTDDRKKSVSAANPRGQ